MALNWDCVSSGGPLYPSAIYGKDIILSSIFNQLLLNLLKQAKFYVYPWFFCYVFLLLQIYVYKQKLDIYRYYNNSNDDDGGDDDDHYGNRGRVGK